jgi:hypothetical protein
MLRCSVHQTEVARKHTKNFALARLKLEIDQCREGATIWHPQHHPEIFVVPQFEHTVFRPHICRELESSPLRIRHIERPVLSTRASSKSSRLPVRVECVKLKYSLVGLHETEISLCNEVCFSDRIIDDFIKAYAPPADADPGYAESLWAAGIISLEALERNGFGPPMHDVVNGYAVIKSRRGKRIQSNLPR